MRIEASSLEIGFVWDLATGKPGEPRELHRIEERAKRLAADGFGSKDHIEELLADLGLPWELGRSAPAFLGLGLQTMFPRPSARADFTFGGDFAPAAAIAAAVIRLERLGLAVDPTPLVAAVRPTLLKRKVLTLDEMAVLWFAKERHRNEPIVLAADGAWPISRWAENPTILLTGYKAFATREADHVTALEVVAPRYRERRTGWLQ